MRDRVFVRTFLLNSFLVTCGYGLLALVMPFGKDQAGIDERSIGVIWLVNTLVVVAFQLPVSRLIEGKRRMLSIVAMGGVWAVAWLLVAAGGAWLDATAATVVLALALGVFGVGEWLHGVVVGVAALRVERSLPERVRRTPG